jgi:hypothetical protein
MLLDAMIVMRATEQEAKSPPRRGAAVASRSAALGSAGADESQDAVASYRPPQPAGVAPPVVHGWAGPPRKAAGSPPTTAAADDEHG